MKHILRIFGVVSVILLAALITALSCNNDDKSNNNNNSGGGSGGSGGNGGGGGGGVNRATIPWDCSGPAYTGPIKVTAFRTGMTVDSNTDACIHVTIGSEAFTAYNEDDFNTGIRRYFYGDTDRLSEIFLDVEYDGATGGLVVVVDGTWDPKNLLIPFTSDPPGYGIKEGVHLNSVRKLTNSPNFIDEHVAVSGFATPDHYFVTNRDGTVERKNAHSVRDLGLNIFSAFIDENLYFPRIYFPAVTPTGTPNPNHNVVNGKPLPLNNIPDLQPRIFCRTIVREITEIPYDIAFSGGWATDATVQDKVLDKTLTGGQRARCFTANASDPYVKAWSPQNIIIGYDTDNVTPLRRVRNAPVMEYKKFTDSADRSAWVAAAGAKSEIRLRAIAMRTDAVKVKDLLPGADNATKLKSLVGGLNPTKQGSLSTEIVKSVQAANANLKPEDIFTSVGLTIKIKP